MIIYTLTITETQKSFSPMEVHTFVSHEQAHKAMIQKFHDKLKEFHMDIPIEELDNPNGYENGELAVGYDYARDDESMTLYEIFETEISLRDIIIGTIITQVHLDYVVPQRFDDTLYAMLNEYKDNTLFGMVSESDFINEHLIGEQLYEHALAELGGKTNSCYTEKILNYLDGDGSTKFLEERCCEFQFSELPENVEKAMTAHQRWFLGMLCLCDGNQTMINLVREDIDSKQPLGDKIFALDRKREFVAENKGQLCENHRELCSELSDEQYYEMMANILNHKYEFGCGENFYKQMLHIYEEMTYVVYKVIKCYGINDLLKDYGDVIKLNDTEGEIGWCVVFEGDPYEIATAIDSIKVTYDNLF